MRNNAPHIEGSKPQLLGKKITKAREAKSLSIYALAKLAGIHRSTITDLEDGAIRNPSPEILAKLAAQLDLTLADLYSLAGYAVPAELPSFDGYMAAKFRGLPNDAIEEISGHLKYLQAKHGLDPAGPEPGEDEQ
jgi:transcriptional regulator with XRE-family HTH domain